MFLQILSIVVFLHEPIGKSNRASSSSILGEEQDSFVI